MGARPASTMVAIVVRFFRRVWCIVVTLSVWKEDCFLMQSLGSYINYGINDANVKSIN